MINQHNNMKTTTNGIQYYCDDPDVVEMAENVERGATLLDAKRQGWHKQVAAAMVNGNFDMMSWDHCVAGTLEIVKEHQQDIYFQFNGTKLIGLEEGTRHGFVTTDDADDNLGSEAWSILEDLWREQIEARGTKTL